jgi:hypothetical protein
MKHLSLFMLSPVPFYVVEGPLDNPTAIFDYKFGGATLTPQRIQQIRQVGQFGPNVPITGVHP